MSKEANQTTPLCKIYPSFHVTAQQTNIATYMT